MNTIDTWENATWVFVFGPGTLLTILIVFIAVILLVAFFVQIIRHENHVYAQIIEHQPLEPGPAAEGEPTVY